MPVGMVGSEQQSGLRREGQGPGQTLGHVGRGKEGQVALPHTRAHVLFVPGLRLWALGACPSPTQGSSFLSYSLQILLHTGGSSSS